MFEFDGANWARARASSTKARGTSCWGKNIRVEWRTLIASSRSNMRWLKYRLFSNRKEIALGVIGLALWCNRDCVHSALTPLFFAASVSDPYCLPRHLLFSGQTRAAATKSDACQPSNNVLAETEIPSRA